MNKATLVIGALALLALLTFCVFGFIATLEPIDASTQLTWPLVYFLVGQVSMGGIAVLLRVLLRPRKPRP
jgi:uncharacterized membrane protein